MGSSSNTAGAGSTISSTSSTTTGGRGSDCSGSFSIRARMPLAAAITGRTSLRVIASISLRPSESKGSSTATITAPSAAKATGTAR